MFTLSHITHCLLGFASSFLFFLHKEFRPSQLAILAGRLVKNLTADIPEPEHPQASSSPSSLSTFTRCSPTMSTGPAPLAPLPTLTSL